MRLLAIEERPGVKDVRREESPLDEIPRQPDVHPIPLEKNVCREGSPLKDGEFRQTVVAVHQIALELKKVVRREGSPPGEGEFRPLVEDVRTIALEERNVMEGIVKIDPDEYVSLPAREDSPHQDGELRVQSGDQELQSAGALDETARPPHNFSRCWTCNQTSLVPVVVSAPPHAQDKDGAQELAYMCTYPNCPNCGKAISELPRSDK